MHPFTKSPQTPKPQMHIHVKKTQSKKPCQLFRMTMPPCLAMLVLVCLTSPAIASPDPNLLKSELDEADEVLRLHVDQVETTEQKGFTTTYTILATVKEVRRSKEGYTPGSRIIFKSYTISRNARQHGFVGPRAPEKLFRGWTGWAYLNDETGDGLEPAAYGDSFRRTKR